MCRRFGWLNSRVLLYRQAELAELEETLLAMDKEDNAYRDGITLKSKKEDDERVDIEDSQYSRQTLINKIDTKLKEYSEFSLLVHSPILNVKTKKVLDADILAFINRWIDIPSQSPCCVEKTKHAQLQFFQKLDDWSEAGLARWDGFHSTHRRFCCSSRQSRRRLVWWFHRRLLNQNPQWSRTRTFFFLFSPGDLSSQLISLLRPYRNYFPDLKNSLNPMTRTCTCTQNTASIPLSAWFWPPSPLSYSLYPPQFFTKSRAVRHSRLGWSCFSRFFSVSRLVYWRKQKGMRCLLLPLRKFFFLSFSSSFLSLLSHLSCIVIQILEELFALSDYDYYFFFFFRSMLSMRNKLSCRQRAVRI